MSRHRVHVERDIDYLPQELEDILMDWGRYMRSDCVGPKVPTSCGSAEGDYPIPVWDEDDGREIEPNARLGELVDMLWAKLPVEPRQVLKMEYIEHFHFPDKMPEYRKTRIRARRLGLPITTYETTLSAGRRMLFYLLKEHGVLV